MHTEIQGSLTHNVTPVRIYAKSISGREIEGKGTVESETRSVEQSGDFR